MIIEPKVRGFICTTAHPSGCRESVKRQIDYVKANVKNDGKVKNVLVIGASTGYGLASRIALAFGAGAKTLGVIYEREAANGRTATAGWYNTAAFEDFAKAEGIYATSINGDGFSREVKENAVQIIKRDMGKVDTIVYSLASPRRLMLDGTVCNSVLKTVGEPYTNKTIDLRTNDVGEVTITPSTEQEIESTVKVMGGEDWAEWIKALSDGGVLAEDATTLAYSYIGPQLTHPIYLNGTIGAAKRDLYNTAYKLFTKYNITARVSVNKALVTQSSAAIPVVPLYISLLYKVMKKSSSHEGCIEQMCRLFYNKIEQYDESGYIRLDDYEMDKQVQSEVAKAWETVTTANINELADIDGYWDDFYRMFGFKYDNVDYGIETNADVQIPSIIK